MAYIRVLCKMSWLPCYQMANSTGHIVHVSMYGHIPYKDVYLLLYSTISSAVQLLVQDMEGGCSAALNNMVKVNMADESGPIVAILCSFPVLPLPPPSSHGKQWSQWGTKAPM